MLSHLVGESHQLFNRLPDKTSSQCGLHGYQTWSTPSDPHFVSRHKIARFLDRCHRPADRVIIKNLRGSLHQHASGLQIIQIVRPCSCSAEDCTPDQQVIPRRREVSLSPRVQFILQRCTRTWCTSIRDQNSPMKPIQHLMPLFTDRIERRHGRRIASTLAVSCQFTLSASDMRSRRTRSRALHGPAPLDVLFNGRLTRVSKTIPPCREVTKSSAPGSSRNLAQNKHMHVSLQCQIEIRIPLCTL